MNKSRNFLYLSSLKYIFGLNVKINYRVWSIIFDITYYFLTNQIVRVRIQTHVSESIDCRFG